MRRERPLLAIAGNGGRRWSIDSFPRYSSIHAANLPGFFYLHVHCSEEDFRDFCVNIEPFGVVDARWCVSGPNGKLVPFGEWSKVKRIYFRGAHFEALAALWVEFASVRQPLEVLQ